MKHPYYLLAALALSCSGKTNDQVLLPESDKDVVCFVYHRFGDGRFPSTNISAADFEAHLQYLSEHHFQVLTLSGAITYLQGGGAAAKTVVLTIDDAYKSFYEKGLPLLKKYNMPATLFINTETVGAADYMNWTELKAATEARVEIGNHTHSHRYFLNDPADTRYAAFEDEIEQSQSVIAEHLHLTPAVFAYPYGEYDSAMKAIVKKAGFRCAAAQNSGVLYYGADLFCIPRFPMAEAYAGLNKFAEKAAMKPLHVTARWPHNAVLTAGDERPVLRLTVRTPGLQPARLQCFVQGSECKINTIEKKPAEITLTLQASSSIANRRRTLYTVTVPDSAGAWHWYSHLWINPDVK